MSVLACSTFETSFLLWPGVAEPIAKAQGQLQPLQFSLWEMIVLVHELFKSAPRDSWM